jgi:hypothetical protein
MSSHTQLTEAEMLPLLEALRERRLDKVRSLRFGENQLGGAGVRALLEAMARGQEIEELRIEGVPNQGGPLTEQDLLHLVSRRECIGSGRASVY